MAVRARIGGRPRAVGGPDLGVGLGGVHPVGREGGDLVALEGDQGRHHHGGAGDDEGRQLVDGRLAGAGGEYGEDVAAGSRGPDGLLLAGPRPLEAEGLEGQAPEPAGVGGGPGPSPAWLFLDAQDGEDGGDQVAGSDTLQLVGHAPGAGDGDEGATGLLVAGDLGPGHRSPTADHCH